jgi:hypothetical protein
MRHRISYVSPDPYIYTCIFSTLSYMYCRSEGRPISYRIASHRIVSYRIVLYLVFTISKDALRPYVLLSGGYDLDRTRLSAFPSEGSLLQFQSPVPSIKHDPPTPQLLLYIPYPV